MDIIGIIAVLIASIWAIITGFSGGMFLTALTGNFIKSGAIFAYALGCLGLYGIYYILFNALEISIKS